MKMCVAFILTLCVAQAGAQTPALQQIAGMEKKAFAARFGAQHTSIASNNFRVHYYECNWQVNPTVYFITGKVTAHFIITQATDNLVFDLSHLLIVDSVLVHRRVVPFTQADDESLTINLPAVFNAGDSSSVTIYYHGKPPTRDASFVTAKHNNTPVLWTLSEPYGAKDWWPCRNGLDDKADSLDVHIVYPSQYKATSNGLLQSETALNDSTTVAFYKHRYPIASYLVAIAVSNYSIYTQQVQLGNASLPIIMYVYPETLDNFKRDAQYLVSALQVYYQCFGDYPFMREKYGQTQFNYGGGMEHQTNSFVGSSNPNLMAHELGHQWFGDKVTCGSWQDIWLNEGFAEYLADFLYNEKAGTGYYDAYVKGDLNNATSQPDGSVWVPDTTDVNRIFSSRLTYAKGAFLVRMLRWTLGDTAFFKGMRSYLNDETLHYNFARVSDLQRHLEESGNTSLDYFFNQWYYGQGYPSFKVSWQQNLNNYAKITVSQTTSHPSIGFYKVPLALTFKNSTQSKTVILNDSINNLETVLDIGFAADTVLIDPDIQLLSKNNTSIKLQPASNAINDVTIYPNPFKDKLWLSIKNPREQKWQVQLYNVPGQKLAASTFNITGADAILQLPLPLYISGGIYFLKVDGGDVHVVKKLVKQ